MLSLSKNISYLTTSHSGFIFLITSSHTSVFFLPTESLKAINCLLILEISTLSKSIIITFPIPLLTNDSIALPPTPPNPTIKTDLFLIRVKLSFPINLSILSNI